VPPNSSVHPDIQRFIDAAASFDHMPRFTYIIVGQTLQGSAEVHQGGLRLTEIGFKLLGGGVLGVLLGALLSVPLLFQLGFLASVASCGCIAAGLLMGFKPTDRVVTFSIILSTTPPKWTSDDDEFWKDVKAFFLNPGTQ
jgi:hypothetical protein